MPIIPQPEKSLLICINKIKKILIIKVPLFLIFFSMNEIIIARIKLSLVRGLFPNVLPALPQPPQPFCEAGAIIIPN